MTNGVNDLPVKSLKSVAKVVPKMLKRIIVEFRTNQVRKTVTSFFDSQHIVIPFLLVVIRSLVPANVTHTKS